MNYTKEYRALHASAPGIFAGYSIMPHVDAITGLVRQHRATSLFDYGCGKGHQYSVEKVHEAWGGIMPTLYDPGVIGLSRLPFDDKFDGVICTDVLEHLEEYDLPHALRTLHAYAGKFLFISVCARAARKKFPDGRNVHRTIKDKRWWRRLVKEYEVEGVQTVLRVVR
jgi:SAM-dependent methyltransferase